MSLEGEVILDLVGVAETPLYSAYREIEEESGIGLDEFLSLVERLLVEGKLRLWSIDFETQSREELAKVSPDLARQYASRAPLEASYDPFGLSLTLGPGFEPEEPGWNEEIDFVRERFSLECKTGLEDEALRALAHRYPEFRLQVTQRISAGTVTRLEGTARRSRAKRSANPSRW